MMTTQSMTIEREMHTHTRRDTPHAVAVLGNTRPCVISLHPLVPRLRPPPLSVAAREHACMAS
jgi:hypothetical protein